MDDWLTPRGLQEWIDSLQESRFWPVFRETDSLVERGRLWLVGVPRPTHRDALRETDFDKELQAGDLSAHHSTRLRYRGPDRVSQRIFEMRNTRPNVDGWFATLSDMHLITHQEGHTSGRNHVTLASDAISSYTV